MVRRGRQPERGAAAAVRAVHGHVEGLWRAPGADVRLPVLRRRGAARGRPLAAPADAARARRRGHARRVRGLDDPALRRDRARRHRRRVHVGVPGEPRLREPVRRALSGVRAHSPPRPGPPRGGRPAGDLRRAAAPLRFPHRGRRGLGRSVTGAALRRAVRPAGRVRGVRRVRRRRHRLLRRRVHDGCRRGGMVCTLPHRRHAAPCDGRLRSVRPALPRRSAGRKAVGQAAPARVVGRHAARRQHRAALLPLERGRRTGIALGPGPAARRAQRRAADRGESGGAWVARRRRRSAVVARHRRLVGERHAGRPGRARRIRRRRIRAPDARRPVLGWPRGPGGRCDAGRHVAGAGRARVPAGRRGAAGALDSAVADVRGARRAGPGRRRGRAAQPAGGVAGGGARACRRSFSSSGPR